MLRYRADLRSVFFMILTTGLLVILWQWSAQMSTSVFILVYSAQLLMAIVVSVITHNHQHLGMWHNKWMNMFMDSWLSVFYGFPVFAWIPTHNVNHHRYINKEEDLTKTYRYSEKNNLVTLLTYPSISGYFQQQAVGKYLTNLWSQNRAKFWMCILQIVILVTWVGIALLVDWKKALLFVVIPQQVSVFIVLIFNYIQHVHTDEETAFNNSRNFTGGVLNYVLLNNGYHMAHHVNAGLHWSLLREKHKELEPKIDPILNETNLGWFLTRNYILGIFVPSLRTNNLRANRLKGAAT